MAEIPACSDHHYRYAIGVGSNRGERHHLIAQAALALAADGSCAILRQSALHTTLPVGGPAGQGAFLNGAWLVATSLGPHQLLTRLQQIESALGRVRTVHWGARTLDLDLLMREDGLEVASPVLSLPHPRLAQRAFVLLPLVEIVPAWSIERPPAGGGHTGDLPGGGPKRRITIRELAELVASQHGACP